MQPPIAEENMTKAYWYFDFISPFAYLQFGRFCNLPAKLEIECKPVVFAGLLKSAGQLGPAEIPSKRKYSYRFFKWLADQRHMPFIMPPHPFNPLPLLRLSMVAGANRANVGTIFHHIYGEGYPADDPVSVAALAQKLGVDNFQERLAAQDVKDALRQNTDEAIAAGAFGVPTFIVNDEVFWGDDSTAMLLDYLDDQNLFETPEMRRISEMPMGVSRRRD
ncbi:MAG: 2-hydroxychromene-2-carboxylate isomerase [Hyphomicrobiaceae bacterium]